MLGERTAGRREKAVFAVRETSLRYPPMRARKKEIPKDGGKKVRVLSISHMPQSRRS